MKIEARKSRIPFNKEEKYQFYVEGKIKVPTVKKNKKKYDKSQRKENKIRYTNI